MTLPDHLLRRDLQCFLWSWWNSRVEGWCSLPSPVTEADGNRVREFSGPDFSREKEQKILQWGTSAIFLSWIYWVIQKKVLLLWCLTVGPGHECLRSVMDWVRQLRRDHNEKGNARWRGYGWRAVVLIWSSRKKKKNLKNSPKSLQTDCEATWEENCFLQTIVMGKLKNNDWFLLSYQFYWGEEEITPVTVLSVQQRQVLFMLLDTKMHL